jgi:hypothetical protein
MIDRSKSDAFEVKEFWQAFQRLEHERSSAETNHRLELKQLLELVFTTRPATPILVEKT